jgi:hypothetical protein
MRLERKRSRTYPEPGEVKSCAGKAGSDLAALHHLVDVTLGLRPVDVVSGRDLTHEIVVAAKTAEIILREFPPLRADVIQDAFLRLAEVRKGGGWLS